MAPETTSARHVVEYIVQPGDTWSGLAGRFLRNQSRYPELLALNNLSPGAPLFVGQKLLMPLLEAGDDSGSPGQVIRLGQGAVQKIDGRLVEELKDKWVSTGKLNTNADDVTVLRAFVNEIEGWRVDKPEVITYVVQPGDSWSRIAGRFLDSQARYREIIEFNQLPPGAPLRVGQQIRIPPK